MRWEVAILLDAQNGAFLQCSEGCLYRFELLLCFVSQTGTIFESIRMPNLSQILICRRNLFERYRRGEPKSGHIGFTTFHTYSVPLLPLSKIPVNLES